MGESYRISMVACYCNYNLIFRCNQLKNYSKMIENKFNTLLDFSRMPRIVSSFLNETKLMKFEAHFQVLKRKSSKDQRCQQAIEVALKALHGQIDIQNYFQKVASKIKSKKQVQQNNLEKLNSIQKNQGQVKYVVPVQQNSFKIQIEPKQIIQQKQIQTIIEQLIQSNIITKYNIINVLQSGFIEPLDNSKNQKSKEIQKKLKHILLSKYFNKAKKQKKNLVVPQILKSKIKKTKKIHAKQKLINKIYKKSKIQIKKSINTSKIDIERLSIKKVYSIIQKSSVSKIQSRETAIQIVKSLASFYEIDSKRFKQQYIKVLRQLQQNSCSNLQNILSKYENITQKMSSQDENGDKLTKIFQETEVNSCCINSIYSN